MWGADITCALLESLSSQFIRRNVYPPIKTFICSSVLLECNINIVNVALKVMILCFGPHQFCPGIRPSLQTIAIGLVAFGENYRPHQSGIGQHRLHCHSSVTLSSHLTSPPPRRSWTALPLSVTTLSQSFDATVWMCCMLFHPFWNPRR